MMSLASSNQVPPWSEDEHTRVHVALSVGQQTTVQSHDVDQVQLLTLITRQTLNLDVEG